MLNKRSGRRRAKRAPSAEQAYRLQDAGFPAAVTADKKIGARAEQKPLLSDISDPVDVQALQVQRTSQEERDIEEGLPYRRIGITT